MRFLYTTADRVALLGTLPLGLMVLPMPLRSSLKLRLTIFDIFFLTEVLFSVPKETEREKWKCSSGLEGESCCCTLRLWVNLGGEGKTAHLQVCVLHVLPLFPPSHILSFHECRGCGETSLARCLVTVVGITLPNRRVSLYVQCTCTL